MNASACVMQPESCAVVEAGFWQIVLHEAESGKDAELPDARFRAAAVSCRTSCRRWSPCGDTHIASSADCTLFTATFVIGRPHTVRPPASAMMPAVIVGWFL